MLGPLTATIGDCQAEIIFVQAFLSHPGATKSDIKPRFRRLETVLRDLSLELETLTSELPERLRSHGRISDLRAAIRQMEAATRSFQTSL